MFKNLLSPRVILLAAAFLLSVGIAAAQDGPPANQPPMDRPPNDDRPNILTQLGLSQDQIQQFRRANQAHRPQMNAAQQKLREANRDLDMAIYADTVSEETVHAKLRVFQEAQAEVNMLRFLNELTIRKILTPDQLIRFREIRRRFAEARERMQQLPRHLRNGNSPSDPNQSKPPIEKNQQTRPVDRPVRRIN